MEQAAHPTLPAAHSAAIQHHWLGWPLVGSCTLPCSVHRSALSTPQLCCRVCIALAREAWGPMSMTQRHRRGTRTRHTWHKQGCGQVDGTAQAQGAAASTGLCGANELGQRPERCHPPMGRAVRARPCKGRHWSAGHQTSRDLKHAHHHSSRHQPLSNARRTPPTLLSYAAPAAPGSLLHSLRLYTHSWTQTHARMLKKQRKQLEALAKGLSPWPCKALEPSLLPRLPNRPPDANANTTHYRNKTEQSQCASCTCPDPRYHHTNDVKTVT